jgi:chromosome partitioning protein
VQSIKAQFVQVVVFASAKGGSSKTTLAAHLAVAAESAGDGPVVLLDMDPQGSLAAWWNAREADAPAFSPATLADLPERLSALAEAGYALAMVDTPPAMTEAIRAVVELADLVVIPVRPSPHDLRAVGSTVEIAREAKRSFVFTVTQAKANAGLTVQAVAALSEHGRVSPTVMHDRVAYAGSMTDGRTVLETDPRGPAAIETAALWKLVNKRLHESKKERKPNDESPR